MAKSQQTWNKKEREKQKQKKRLDKEKKKEARKANQGSGQLNDMIAYVDENGQISSTPPDPNKKKNIKAENIEISVPKKEFVEDTDIERKGIVKFFNDAKGYGFIKDMKSEENIFVHINSVVGTIKENNKVTFTIEQGPKGLVAVNVKLDN